MNYDDRTWQLLAEQLESDHRIFDPVTRAVMIDDAFKLAMGGFTKYEVPLKLVKFLSNENDTYAWKTASANLDAVLAKMGTEEHRKPFKVFLDFINFLKSIFINFYLNQKRQSSVLKVIAAS